MKGTTLYRFWDSADTLLYVGITGVGTVRWFEHARTKDWWRQVAYVSVEHFDDRVSALAAETLAIRTEKPRHNVIGVRPPTSLKVGIFRPHGTGSVYYRAGDRRWIASLPNGMGRATKACRSREEAERYLADKLGLDYEGGDPIEIERGLLADALRRVGVDDAIAPALFTAYLEAWLARPDEDYVEPPNEEIA